MRFIYYITESRRPTGTYQVNTHLPYSLTHYMHYLSFPKSERTLPELPPPSSKRTRPSIGTELS